VHAYLDGFAACVLNGEGLAIGNGKSRANFELLPLTVQDTNPDSSANITDQCAYELNCSNGLPRPDEQIVDFNV
jgi:hypothetical protein